MYGLNFLFSCLAYENRSIFEFRLRYNPTENQSIKVVEMRKEGDWKLHSVRLFSVFFSLNYYQYE